MKYWLFIGRWQCLPPHKGHEALIRSKLDIGESVCIGIRDTVIDKDNPYTFQERSAALTKMFEKEYFEDRFLILRVPDIKGIVVGRDVGYKIEEVRLDKKTESISATKIRNESSNNRH